MGERKSHNIQQNTSKTVHTIPAKNVCFMGGSVRCLAWQVEGENARKIIEIGTFDGNTALNIAANTPDEARIFTVDLPKDWAEAERRNEVDSSA